MDLVRNILRWVKGHTLLSVVIVIVAIGILSFVRFINARSEGTFSEPLRRGHIVESVYGIGTVTANKSWRITPGVVNTIRDMWVLEGDEVKKGQKLIANDADTWRAPFDGTITSLPYKVGENVFSSVPILTLVDLSDRYLVVSMEQQAALRVKRGQSATMSFDTMRAERFNGKVVAVYSNDINYLARIDIGQVPNNILPGMTADVAIELQEKNDVLLVPVAALENGDTVWRKRGHEIPTKIMIKTGIIDKDLAQVTDGDLAAGDRLLLRKDLTK